MPERCKGKGQLSCSKLQVSVASRKIRDSRYTSPENFFSYALQIGIKWYQNISTNVYIVMFTNFLRYDMISLAWYFTLWKQYTIFNEKGTYDPLGPLRKVPRPHAPSPASPVSVINQLTDNPTYLLTCKLKKGSTVYDLHELLHCF